MAKTTVIVPANLARSWALELDIANMTTRSIVLTVRFNRNILVWAALSLFVVLGSGCGGINMTHSVSPATFFLPGLMQSTPRSVDPLAPALFLAESQTVAQAR
jgi:hypothetical protein